MREDALRDLLTRLPDLHERLQSEHMDCGPDTWLAVHDLLLSLAGQGRLPDDPLGLIPLIGPIVCSNPVHQQRFPEIFKNWWKKNQNEISPASLSVESAASLAVQSIHNPLQRVDRRGRMGLAAILVVLALLLASLPFALNRMRDGDPAAVPSTPAKTQPSTSTGPPPEKMPKVAIDDWAPPRRLPEWPPIPQAWADWLPVIGTWLPWLLAGAPVLGLLAWHYRKQWVLRKNRPDADDVSDWLKLRLPPGSRLFGGPQTQVALRRLRSTVWQPTRRLDVAATVEATARRAGEYQPRYGERRAAPTYLLLVQSRHRHDQSAALAEELLDRFRDQGLLVESYRFRDDPRWLIPWTRPQHESSSLRRLACDYPDARLIVVSGGEILIHPITGRPRAWLDELSRWPQRAWLHPDPLRADLAEYLWKREFLPLPMSSESLESVSHWLAGWRARGQPRPTPENPPEPLPRLFARMPERWLDAVLPYGEDLEETLRQLREFLREDGYQLLSAAAAYPEPRWNLSQALDFLLFERATPEQRETRLGSLGRLPWIRHGHLPDYLRERLLADLKPEERERIRDVYAKLLALPAQMDGPGVLRLPIAVPKRRKLRQILSMFTGGQRGQSQLDDPIFLNLLLGDRLSLLDFHLPRALASILPGAHWRINPWPALMAMVAVVGLTFGLGQIWRQWGENGLIRAASAVARWENSGWTVQVNSTADNALLEQALWDVLKSAGYREGLTRGDVSGKQTENRLQHSPGHEAEARRLADHVRHATYGAPVKLEESNVLTKKEMSLELVQTYQALTIFHDRLSNPNKTTAPVAFSVFRGPFKRPESTTKLAAPADTPPKEFGPEMVVLPAGQFQMGSPDSEKYRSPDEGPQHTVTLAQLFAIGRHEVTFDEYKRFADATSRKLPSDSGWGQGKRPVINVNWEDAKAYADWLSQQTGQNYRLPTEAEWEYAARAGTETSWFWGADEAQMDQYAWFDKNSDNQSHPVGEKRPNAFGLYDTAGNVWEWTADCYHDSYQKAPVVGSAWLENDPKNCDRRVVRGGSWGLDPQYLRSANRDRDRSDGADIDLGFRLARAL